MNDIIFRNNFFFNKHTFFKHKYTDMRHGAPYHYFAYMLRGHARIVSEEKSIEISEGDLFYIPEELSYQSYWDSKDEISFLSFGVHYFPEAADKKFSLHIIECSDTVKEKFKQVPIKEQLDSNTVSLFYGAVSEVIELLDHSPKNAKKEIIERAARYIYDNTDCSVSDIARPCNVSKSSLYYVFKSQGVKPNELIQKMRCKRAEELLCSTDRSVQEISDMLGFSSTSYFRKVLHKHFAKTPLEIRKASKI